MSVVLVTGASRGIGRAIVARFLREGCRVVACARGEAGLAELKADFPEVDCVPCDMRDGAAVDAPCRASTSRASASTAAPTCSVPTG